MKVEIALAGLQDRVFEVPLPASVYSGLAVGEKILFFVDEGSNAAGQPKLQAVEIKNRNVQAKTLIEDVRNFELSADGKKLLVRKGADLYVIDAGTAQPTGQTLAERRVDLAKWTFSVDPREEWRQMFVDAWRMERDYFYDRNLHNVDYQGLLERHRPFVERVSDRAELNDLLAHLVGELSALHTFVRGGDLRQPADNVSPGSLGARLVRDEAKGGYRIEHIYRSDPEYPDNLSPLGKPMSAIREGEIIAGINGAPTLGVPDPSLLLRGTAGQQVLLEIKPAAGGAARKEIVVPMTPGAEADLRYSEWEYTRRLEVEKAGKGDIGYVHLRAMGGDNYTEWVKNFYPVFDRKGLIIDVRHNRGGNIDSWILEKLLRRAWFYWQDRVGKPTWNMQHAFRGHLVVLCNERTASDGEAFAEGFRRLGLGKVIGTRTWGGEIWLSSSNVLVDRGIASAAETGVYGPEGEWLIEGHGVDPDIVVDNLPHATFGGRDAQLEAAVKHLQELIAKDPVEVPKHPPYPDKKEIMRDMIPVPLFPPETPRTGFGVGRECTGDMYRRYVSHYERPMTWRTHCATSATGPGASTGRIRSRGSGGGSPPRPGRSTSTATRWACSPAMPKLRWPRPSGPGRGWPSEAGSRPIRPGSISPNGSARGARPSSARPPTRS